MCVCVCAHACLCVYLKLLVFRGQPVVLCCSGFRLSLHGSQVLLCQLQLCTPTEQRTHHLTTRHWHSGVKPLQHWYNNTSMTPTHTHDDTHSYIYTCMLVLDLNTHTASERNPTFPYTSTHCDKNGLSTWSSPLTSFQGTILLLGGTVCRCISSCLLYARLHMNKQRTTRERM